MSETSGQCSVVRMEEEEGEEEEEERVVREGQLLGMDMGKAHCDYCQVSRNSYFPQHCWRDQVERSCTRVLPGREGRQEPG